MSLGNRRPVCKQRLDHLLVGALALVTFFLNALVPDFRLRTLSVTV